MDALTRKLVREIGRESVSAIYAELASRRAQRAKASGMTVHRCPMIAVMTLFGVLSVASPYLREPRGKRSSRPLADLGLRHGARTPAVERALTDFGAEEGRKQSERHLSTTNLCLLLHPAPGSMLFASTFAVNRGREEHVARVCGVARRDRARGGRTCAFARTFARA